MLGVVFVGRRQCWSPCRRWGLTTSQPTYHEWCLVRPPVSVGNYKIDVWLYDVFFLWTTWDWCKCNSLQKLQLPTRTTFQPTQHSNFWNSSERSVSGQFGFGEWNVMLISVFFLSAINRRPLFSLFSLFSFCLDISQPAMFDDTNGQANSPSSSIYIYMYECVYIYNYKYIHMYSYSIDIPLIFHQHSIFSLAQRFSYVKGLPDWTDHISGASLGGQRFQLRGPTTCHHFRCICQNGLLALDLLIFLGWGVEWEV